MITDELVLEVHFDFKLEKYILYCGYVFLEDGEIIDSGMEEFNLKERLEMEERNKKLDSKFKGSNNYHYSLTSYYVAVKAVKSFLSDNDDYSVVLYCNQNELIFNWVKDLNRKINISYNKIVSNIRKELHNVWVLVGDNVEHSYTKISGSKNEAKKALSKRLKVMDKGRQINSLNVGDYEFSVDFRDFDNISDINSEPDVMESVYMGYIKNDN